jgi:phage-related protein
MAVSFTFTPAFHPDWGVQRQFKPRVLKAEFGDGYSQRAGDGINSNPVNISATWTNLSVDEKDYILNFFAARAGYQAFYYTYVDEASPKVYVCEEWSSTHNDSTAYTVTAKLVQIYDF